MLILGYHLQVFSTHEDIATKLIHRFSLAKVKNMSHISGCGQHQMLSIT